MQRAWLIAVFVAAWSAGAGIARAQNIEVTVLAFEGRSAGTFDLADLATVAANPIGVAECDSPITFRFTSLDIARASLHFFEGATCDDPTVRTDTSSTACEELPVPSVAIDGRLQQDVDVVPRDIVPCDTTGSGVETIWVLALNTETDAVTEAGQQVTFPVAYDFAAPAAPSGLTGSGGETSARISWSSPGEQVSKYEVFLDPTGCTDGTVTSTGLTSTPPDERLLVAEVSGTATSYSVAFPSDVPVGSEAAIAIRAIDRAENVGPLSTPICVERIDVTTWWDTYCSGADGGTAEVCTNGGCAAAPSREGAGGSVLLLGIALFFAVARRRAR